MQAKYYFRGCRLCIIHARATMAIIPQPLDDDMADDNLWPQELTDADRETVADECDICEYFGSARSVVAAERAVRVAQTDAARDDAQLHLNAALTHHDDIERGLRARKITLPRLR